MNFLKSSVRLFWRINNKFLRFLFVGTLNTVVGYLFFIFFIWTGLHYGLALLCANVLGVAWNYKTTGVLVFESHSNRLVFWFFLVYVFVYVVNFGELWLLDRSGLYEWILSSRYLDFLQTLPLNLGKIGDVIGQTIVMLPNAMLSFLLLRFFVFRKKLINRDLSC